MAGKTAFATILEREGEYAAMAASLGAHAEHVTDPKEVGPAIERAMEISATGQPCVLEIFTREEPVFS